jgi:hypothetical protein
VTLDGTLRHCRDAWGFGPHPLRRATSRYFEICCAHVDGAQVEAQVTDDGARCNLRQSLSGPLGQIAGSKAATSGTCLAGQRKLLSWPRSPQLITRGGTVRNEDDEVKGGVHLRIAADAPAEGAAGWCGLRLEICTGSPSRQPFPRDCDTEWHFESLPGRIDRLSLVCGFCPKKPYSER